MGKPVLGIMTLYLNDRGLLEERPVYERMTVIGRKLGLDVIVFTPDDVRGKSNRIHAMRFSPSSGSWRREWTGFPTMIYDRCRIQRSKRFERLKRFRARYGHLLYLNKPIGNKWSIYRLLSRDGRFRSHLPATRLYESSHDLTDMIKRHSLIYLKPAGGTGGRGILRIQRSGGSLLIQGRDQSRRIIRPFRIRASALPARLASWDLRGRRYLVQQGIHIRLADGRVHDYRLLVQKNGQGEWSVTGCAVRIGAKGSVTSNLHGGGRAASLDSVLPGWVGSEAKAERVRQRIGQFGIDAARYIEDNFGPLCELALDLAIERSGHFWLLEVNPKPARDVFRRAGEKDTYRRALVRPLQYALWLYRQKQRRRRSTGKTAGRLAERTIGRTTGRMSELSGERMMEFAAGDSSDQAWERAAERTERTTGTSEGVDGKRTSDRTRSLSVPDSRVNHRTLLQPADSPSGRKVKRAGKQQPKAAVSSYQEAADG